MFLLSLQILVDLNSKCSYKILILIFVYTKITFISCLNTLQGLVLNTILNNNLSIKCMLRESHNLN